MTARSCLNFHRAEQAMTDSTSTKPNYKKTLNLPKTSFPMRANLAQNEPQSRKRWAEQNLYESVIDARDATAAEPFLFHDGPPYANGPIHVGHLLNKVLKDFVVRSQLLLNRQCRYVPGWDCHGLPIEHRVMTELLAEDKAARLDQLDDEQRRVAIRRECAKYAEKFVKLQAEQMQQLLTLADYENPYLTMSPEYEQAVLDVFAELVSQGLVYRSVKPVHWSIANQTALADAELEYMDREDPSIYVDFEAADRGAVAKAFNVELDATPCFMIWTTTPWTLPANLAIAVHEQHEYALAEVDGTVTVIAADLIKHVTELAGSTSVEVLATAAGKKLVGLTYRHPFCDRAGRIVSAEYVTLDDGTGLVHTAPGHGVDDYNTGRREGLEIYCPVQGDGTFDESVPEWLVGRLVWDANNDIIEHLRRSGHLFHSFRFTHSYPHDWRSKTPVIFRCTEQWFVNVDEKTMYGETLREAAIRTTGESVDFIPAWGRNRLQGMLESRPDWCLSRQRAWGLPIPAFRTPEGEVLLTASSVHAVARVFGEQGSDAWFTERAEMLLQYYEPGNDPAAPDDLDIASLEKMHDIFDVWFESGSSWNAVMRQRDLGYPADLYLEGSDQHRGWFQLSLLPALAVTGQPPYRALLTHGFMVDKDGRKMSKSTGNALNVEDLLKDFGADVCRWWVSSLAYDGDIKVDLEFFKVAGESYRKVRNTLRFLLSNLSDYELPEPGAQPEVDRHSIDGYALEELARVQRHVLEAYRRFEFRRAHQLLYDFCNDTLSAFYCAAVKDRLYCDRADSPRRRRTQFVMSRIVETLCRLLAPILPHTADEAFRALKGEFDVCVHYERAESIEYVAGEHWPTVLAMRDRALKALEEAKAHGIDNALDAEVILPDPDGMLKAFANDWPDMLGVSRVRFSDGGDDAITVNDLSDEPRCDRSWKRDGTVRQRSDGGWLTDRDAEAVGVS